MTGYLLDTNIFIEAKNRHYGFDFCPAFWDWLIEQNSKGKVASIEKVADELFAQEDELTEWARKRSKDFFLKSDDRTLLALNSISDWVEQKNYQDGAISKFMGCADYWFIAHAFAYNYIVVTHEKISDGSRKIKIPNVCDGLKVHHMSPYEMLRKEGAKFILEPDEKITR